MPRVTKATLDAVARDMGVTVERNTWVHHVEVVMDAPEGKVFAGTHTHCVVNVGATWTDAHASAMEDLRNGLAPCDATECDVCEGH